MSNTFFIFYCDYYQTSQQNNIYFATFMSFNNDFLIYFTLCLYYCSYQNLVKLKGRAILITLNYYQLTFIIQSALEINYYLAIFDVAQFVQYSLTHYRETLLDTYLVYVAVRFIWGSIFWENPECLVCDRNNDCVYTSDIYGNE